MNGMYKCDMQVCWIRGEVVSFFWQDVWEKEFNFVVQCDLENEVLFLIENVVELQWLLIKGFFFEFLERKEINF